MIGLRFIFGLSSAVASGGFAIAQPAEPAAYKVIAIPPLANSTFGEAVAVNNLGVAVGRCLVDGVYHGFSFDASSGVVTPHGPLGPDAEHGLWGVNSNGSIVGTMSGATGPFNRALLISPGGPIIDITRETTLRAPMGNAQARGINDAGAIAGTSTFDCSLTESTGYGSRWSPGGFFVTPLLGSNFECAPSTALAINGAGILVGQALMNVGTLADPILVERPFTCNDDGQVPLPTFASSLEWGNALAISSQGDVCGIVQDLSDSGRPYAALWLGGEIVRLNSLAGYAPGTIAFGVNGYVDVVGRSGDEATGEAVIWRSGGDEPISLTSLAEEAPHASNYRLIAALAISDGGFIVGRGVGIDPADSSGNTVPFMLLPCKPVIIRPPTSQTSCLLGDPTFSVEAVGAGPLVYRWRRDGVELTDGVQPSGATILGAHTPTMQIRGFGFGDEGSFDVVITGSCGSTTTAFASTRVCRTDLSCDGIVTDSDFPIFVVAYEILDCADPSMPPGCPADFNADGVVDDEDFLIFVQAYEALLCS